MDSVEYLIGTCYLCAKCLYCKEDSSKLLCECDKNISPTTRNPKSTKSDLAKPIKQATNKYFTNIFETNNNHIAFNDHTSFNIDTKTDRFGYTNFNTDIPVCDNLDFLNEEVKELDLENANSDFNRLLEELDTKNNKYKSNKFLLKLYIKNQDNITIPAKRLNILANSSYKVAKETGTGTQIIDEKDFKSFTENYNQAANKKKDVPVGLLKQVILNYQECIILLGLEQLLANIDTPSSYAIFTSPPKVRGISNSNQSPLQQLLQPVSQLPLQLSSQLSSQIPSQTSSQIPSQMHLQMPSQMSSQMPFSQIGLQMPMQMSLQIPSQPSSQMLSNFSNYSLQPSTNFFSHYSNIPLPVLPNFPLYILSNFSSQLLFSISSQPYFMPFLILPNLSQELTTSLRCIPELKEFLTNMDKAKNANREILACLSKFQDHAIQVKQICKLNDKQFELVGITKTGWKIALQEASNKYN
ncbi:9149_t:CDS:2 [Dentiscutata erythropus]|uniref:9149_t:CDS:1 n=1 Tax=Dentiscutata erythropus TaxID=1348616 RepID=A0A9N9IWI4_9GLOM|nr:9149_t:CDS:2 [Dentiscutata erythropus]